MATSENKQKKKNESGWETFVCTRCGARDTVKGTPTTMFYKSNSDFYTNNGYMPICKKCFSKALTKYNIEYDDMRKAMQRVCMAYDIYYSDSIYNSCKDNYETMAGTYMKRLNMTQYQGKNFTDSLKEGFVFGEKQPGRAKKQVAKKEEVPKPEIPKEYITRWGAGFDYDDYQILEEHYKLLKEANPNNDSNQDIFITDLCYTKMQQMKAVREGRVDDYNKLTESYRKSFSQAGLKTVKEVVGKDDFTFGVNAETIEKYTPAEYYKNKELYRDYDNIGEYINRFMLRPLKNLMFGTKDRDKEYYVKGGDDDDYETEE